MKRIGFVPTRRRRPCASSRTSSIPTRKTIVHAVEDMLGLEAANLDGEDFFSHERQL